MKVIGLDTTLRQETLCIQAGYTPGNGEPRQLPICQSTTFKYATSEDMGKLFDLEADGYFYSRLANPTCDAVAKKICALEGGSAAMLTSSGQAATFLAVFNIAGCGDHIVASSAIYGGSYNLFAVTMKRMGLVWRPPLWIRTAPRKNYTPLSVPTPRRSLGKPLPIPL